MNASDGFNFSPEAWYLAGRLTIQLMPTTEPVSLFLPPDRGIYFASDFHLGSPGPEKSLEREKVAVRWLEHIRKDAAVLFLVGDIFDYWFEYKYVVPRGYVRLLGQLASLADQGVKIYYFTGNHDMWMRDYLEKELGAVVNRHAVRFEIQGEGGKKTFLVGHGDGLGPGDGVYKQLKRLFESPLARWAFRQVHPDMASRLAYAWASHSRSANDRKGEDTFKGEGREWLYLFCRETEALLHHDYYVFGHRHLALDREVAPHSRYINLGEWFSSGTTYPYAHFDGHDLKLKAFKDLR